MINNIFSSFDQKNFFWFSFLYLNFFLIFFINENFLLRKLKIFRKKTFVFINLINRKEIFIFSFLIIFFLNFFSLNMFIFNLTRQVRLNLIIILLFWFPVFLINMTKTKNNFLIHILPLGTSTFLIPLIILIEILRFFIRPLTLFLRLSINIIAGHVLISLIREIILNSNLLIMFILYIYILIKFLVRFIQSYIIITLINLYIEEIYVKYEFYTS